MAAALAENHIGFVLERAPLQKVHEPELGRPICKMKHTYRVKRACDLNDDVERERRKNVPTPMAEEKSNQGPGIPNAQLARTLKRANIPPVFSFAQGVAWEFRRNKNPQAVACCGNRGLGLGFGHREKRQDSDSFIEGVASKRRTAN
ncbi:hypothetical protein DFH09DRAFT_1084469 [Mycena vulgaris]|nr:hypothetical protein DFH09DRAFT_1084469 [Mycena vulgaris]